MNKNQDSTRIMAVLSSLRPAQLKALQLLSSPRRHHNWIPILDDVEPTVIAEATVELIGYADDCEALAEKLADLPAVPLTAPELLVELGL